MRRNSSAYNARGMVFEHHSQLCVWLVVKSLYVFALQILNQKVSTAHVTCNVQALDLVSLS